MADRPIKGSLLVTPWDNAEKALHLQCGMEPLWPDDLLDTRQVMSCLTYHTRTHCINHQHCLLSLQQLHLAISVMSSVHHLCFCLWQEHVFCSHLMCFLWYSCTFDWCQCLYNVFKRARSITTFAMSLHMWVQFCILWMCVMRAQSLTVPMWKGHCSCVCICISGCVRLPVQSHTASACSISTNMLCSCD